MPCGQCVSEIVVSCRDRGCPSPIGAEAAEGDAEGEAEVVGGRLGVEFFDVLRQRRALGPIDGAAAPTPERAATATARAV